MSKRLQILMDERELGHIRRLAAEQNRTVADFVREAVRVAARGTPATTPEKKRQTIAAAVGHRYPTADIDQMLREIEQGYESASRT